MKKQKLSKKEKKKNLLKQYHKLIAITVLGFIVLLSVFFFIFKAEKEAKSSIVVFETTRGNIEIELFLERSPITAENFQYLVQTGYYDGTRFHRVIEGFMVQGGDPNSKDLNARDTWGRGGPGYFIQDEYIEGLSNLRGTIAMANAGEGTGGSQFFINVRDNTYLDWDKEPLTSKHPVFGKVVEGMDIIDEISKVTTTGRPYDRPLEDITIEKAYLK